MKPAPSLWQALGALFERTIGNDTLADPPGDTTWESPVMATPGEVAVNGDDELKASPRELFAVERPHLKPLPVWAPPVYLLHQRLVDLEGLV